MTEFLIHDNKIENGDLVVTGIVNAGTIRPGLIFSHAEPTEIFRGNFGEDLKTVNLTVKRIVAYQQELDELSTGVSGQLWLDGRFATASAKGIMLRSA
jgi:hypothetical protein